MYEETDDKDTQANTQWLMSAADVPNIAELIKEEEGGEYELSKIGDRVVRETDIDKDSRGTWDETMREALDLALQAKKDKTFPWPNAANVKYPLLTTAAIQFNARAYPAIVPGKNVVKCKVNGDDTGQYQVVTDQYGQPVIDQQTGEPAAQEIVPPGAKQERADRVAHHMSWQLTEEMVEWESDTDRLLTVLPITGVVFRKSYFDPSKGRNCSQMVLPSHLYVDYDAPCLEDAPRITQEFELYPHQITERERSGMYLPYDYGVAEGQDDDAPHVFYEQHRLLDLDEDGYPEPYVVTVHRDTKHVCRIVARFTKDDVTINEKGEVAKIEPIHYFTKYGFIPNPESAIYDLGFGMLLNPINETVNTILNQMLDAGTLQNAGGGFIGKGLRIKGGNLRFRPGEFKPIDVSGPKIADSIYHMDHRGPSTVLFQLLGLLIEAGKEIASVKDVLTGESQGANASPTTTIALIEQGLKTFTAIFKRVHRCLKSELLKIYKLNQMYLDEEVYFTLLDDKEAVGRQDYEDADYDVVPVSDPNVVTDMQKMAKAQALMQFAGDPFINQMELRRRYLDAIDIDDIDELLQEPPQQGPELKDQVKAMELELKAMESQQRLPAEITELMTRSIKNIAEAEAKEAGVQIDWYRSLIEAMSNEYQSRAVSGVDGKSGNGNGSQVSQGSGAGPQGPATGSMPLPGPVNSPELAIG